MVSSIPTLTHYHRWMEIALQEAALAEAHGDIPVGALIVSHHPQEGWATLATAHNRREIDHNPAGHAEILALQAAGKALNNWRLTNCILVVTLEPCLMCASAIVQSRVGTVIFGASDAQQGGLGGRLDIRQLTPGVSPQGTTVIAGILQEQCNLQLNAFFKQQRS